MSTFYLWAQNGKPTDMVRNEQVGEYVVVEAMTEDEAVDKMVDITNCAGDWKRSPQEHHMDLDKLKVYLAYIMDQEEVVCIHFLSGVVHRIVKL